MQARNRLGNGGRQRGWHPPSLLPDRAGAVHRSGWRRHGQSLGKERAVRKPWPRLCLDAAESDRVRLWRGRLRDKAFQGYSLALFQRICAVDAPHPLGQSRVHQRSRQLKESARITSALCLHATDQQSHTCRGCGEALRQLVRKPGHPAKCNALAHVLRRSIRSGSDQRVHRPSRDQREQPTNADQRRKGLVARAEAQAARSATPESQIVRECLHQAAGSLERRLARSRILLCEQPPRSRRHSKGPGVERAQEQQGRCDFRQAVNRPASLAPCFVGGNPRSFLQARKLSGQDSCLGG
mmetsp:Transcript_14717/g.55473  ORF Transcript_14717/g.55473 Transcript_14717/m.55473 type:complete len:297 (-) Transcript_14717:825-1715(-)